MKLTFVETVGVLFFTVPPLLALLYRLLNPETINWFFKPIIYYMNNPFDPTLIMGLICIGVSIYMDYEYFSKLEA